MTEVVSTNVSKVAKFLVPDVIFGRGVLSQVGQAARRQGGVHVLVVSDPGVAKAGWTGEVLSNLAAAGVAAELWDGLTPNPKDHEVAAGCAAYTGNGTARERVPLPAELFDGTVNMPVMQQAVKAFLANQRQGNAATKTRRYVTGGNQKPWRQKGTGRARQGSIRAPHWVGGGTVFGPIPRSYAQYVPKQVRALARKSALNARAREGALLVIDRFAFDAPKVQENLSIAS